MNLFGSAGRRRWLAVGVLTLLLISAVFLLWPADSPGGDEQPTPAASAPVSAKPSDTSSLGAAPPAVSSEEKSAAAAIDEGLPRTLNYRVLAEAAARGIYTWDSRSSSYSDVYARVRSWWELLPDGSNPLSVLVREFEGTGVAASTFAALAEQSAHRSGTAESVHCDLELAKVQEYPAPWDGLHVCTVTLQVVDESNNDKNAYAAPVTVMVNCPPARTAPSERCAMVAFYATAERVVY